MITSSFAWAGTFIGCFKYNPENPLLKGPRSKKAKNDVTSCMYFCLERNYPVAGMAASNQCLCGKSVPKLAKQLSEKKCNMKCPGNPRETCGGKYYITIYQAGSSGGSKKNVKVVEPEMVSTTFSWSGYYLGCFKARGINVPKKDQKTIAKNEITACMKICLSKGFKIAAVQDGNQCSCLKKKPNLNLLVKGKQCSKKCPGNPKEKCGGKGFMNIYISGDAKSEIGSVITQVIGMSHIACVL